MITLIIVNSLWVWNELLIAMIFLQKAELRTLMAGLIRFQGRFQINQPVIISMELPIFIELKVTHTNNYVFAKTKLSKLQFFKRYSRIQSLKDYAII